MILLTSSVIKGPNINNSKRVAIVGRLDEPGGVQSVILSLIRGLNSVGIIPDLAWDTPPNPNMLYARNVSAGFHPVHFRLPTKFLDRVPASIRYILRTVNMVTDKDLSVGYDFIYIFYNGFLVKSDTPHIRYLSGPPLLPQLDAVSPGLRGIPYRLLRAVYQKWLRHHAPVYEFHHDSHYVINSEFTAELFQEAHGVRLPVIHPPLDLNGRNILPGDLRRRDTVTYFSRFSDYKRPELVIRLAEHHPEQRFVLMGGMRDQQKQYVQSLVSSAQECRLENTTFIINPTDAQVRKELARTRFYVFPGVNEHFGITTAEAIASGAVPFVHDSGGQREIVPDPRLRFTDSTFFEGFEKLITLPETELQQLQLRMREHVMLFSEDAFIKKMMAFIETSEKVSAECD